MLLSTIEIDDAPDSVAAMMTCGQFHSHQDGKWRYSPYANRGPTVYVNDPTVKFDSHASFPNGYGAAAHASPPMFATIYPDGTRVLTDFCRRREPKYWLLYAPRNDGERELRAWLAAHFDAEC